jgi:hypothetical protein
VKSVSELEKQKTKPTIHDESKAKTKKSRARVDETHTLLQSCGYDGDGDHRFGAAERFLPKIDKIRNSARMAPAQMYQSMTETSIAPA